MDSMTASIELSEDILYKYNFYCDRESDMGQHYYTHELLFKIADVVLVPDSDGKIYQPSVLNWSYEFDIQEPFHTFVCFGIPLTTEKQLIDFFFVMTGEKLK